MPESKQPRDYTPHQQNIIKRYYQEQPTILLTRLSNIVGDLYLSSEKKKEKLWLQVEEILNKIKLGPSRIEHIMKTRRPELVAGLVRELEAK